MTTHNEAQPSTPTGMITLDGLENWVDEGLITTVLPVLPDMGGNLRGKRLAAGKFMQAASQPGRPVAEACAYVLATDIDMSPAQDYDLTSWMAGFQDIAAMPDLGTLRVLRHQSGTALVHCDAAHPGGQPVPVAPRHLLRQQLDALTSEHGVELRAGLENEVVLYDATTLRPVTQHNLDYALQHPRALTDFFTQLERALAFSATPAESVKTEGAPGQIEVAFPYGPAMRACDDYTVYKHLLKEIAGEHGMLPTFMAAPQTGTASGLHVHVSLWQGDEPAFAATGPAELPEAMRHAIAGLLAALPDLAPLYAPNPNSYRRYQPYSFAPTHYTWGVDNRTCAIRVTGHGAGAHLEVRLPGADANPYLAVAAVCAGINYGLAHKMDPPEPWTGDGYEAEAGKGVVPVPSSLTTAARALESSSIANKYFGRDVVTHYATAAYQEVMTLGRLVPDTEINRYRERI
ncbi:glutamine synthetase family protein [Streptomyces poonensis]|uniref:Glutamine synthetase n=1 Tax=Streptomyces poonensis TaxID=68255 RepID=A0A918PFY0_9ACTN|nr:glutamine synthetase family protein [Streptomyces poonensis]GGZ05866.1 glutamine synthetase [Streptomyces poonensis]GLJ92606.1 glutamine synthetase [Streptomyces poonensis]